MSDFEINFDTLVLSKGVHPPERIANGEMCLVEAASAWAGPPAGDSLWRPSDHDPRFSAVISTFCRAWNDRTDFDRRQALKPLICLLDGTAGTPEQEDRRRWMCADWATRTALPMWLRVAGRGEMADEMAALPEITDRAVWNAQRASIIAVREACWQARSVWVDEVQAKVRASAVDVAAADAVAVAAAVAVDVAAAAADADAVAVAAADADAADVAAVAADAAAADVAAVAAAAAADADAARWDAVYRAVYDALCGRWADLPVIRTTTDAVQASAIDLVERLAAVTA